MERRDFLKLGAWGIGGMLLVPGMRAFSEKKWRPGKVKSVIKLTMAGGPSQMETFDYKPMLKKYAGKTIKGFISEKGHDGGVVLPALWPFKRYGKSGAYVSDLFSQTAQLIDELCLIKSCQSSTKNHAISLLEMNTGHLESGHPFLGQWINYALGSGHPQLPGSIVMLDDARGAPFNGSMNWHHGHLQAKSMAMLMGPTDRPLVDLYPSGVGVTSAREQHEYLQLLKKLNSIHQRQHPDNPLFEVRKEIFQIGYEMENQLKIITDLSHEKAELKTLYGIDQERSRVFGTQLLWARKFIEQGVRFVQIYSGASDMLSWDSHQDMHQHETFAKNVDRPIFGLLTDLKRRGLLEETLVVWGGEFGRLPVIDQRETSTKFGRDHNNEAFTYWMCGGGVKKGFSFGETDEFGLKTVKDKVTFGDLHATILHLMGIDHRQLVASFQGSQLQLTKGRDRVIKEILT